MSSSSQKVTATTGSPSSPRHPRILPRTRAMLAAGVTTCSALALAAGVAPPDESPALTVLEPPERSMLRFGDRLAAEGPYLAIASPREGDDANQRASVAIGRLVLDQRDARPRFLAESTVFDAEPGEHFGHAIDLRSYDAGAVESQVMQAKATADASSDAVAETGSARRARRLPRERSNSPALGAFAPNAGAFRPRRTSTSTQSVAHEAPQAAGAAAVLCAGSRRRLILCAIGASNAQTGLRATGAVDLYARVDAGDAGESSAAASGSWIREARIASTRSAPGDRFGHATALGGSMAPTVAVGAPYYDGAGALDNGAVHIFRRFAQPCRPKPPHDTGTTVASPPGDSLDGISGGSSHDQSYDQNYDQQHDRKHAPTHDPTPASADESQRDSPSDSQGAFEAGLLASPSDGSLWREHAVIACPVTSVSAHFGSAIAMRGDLVAIAAPDLRVGAAAACGAVWIYRVTVDGCEAVASLPAPNASAWQWFGADLAMDNTTLAVGVPGGRRTGDGTRCGTVEIYDLATLLVSAAKATAGRTTLEPPFLETGASFGASIAMCGSLLVVGAPGADRPDSDGSPAPALEDAGACLVARLEASARGAAPTATIVAALAPPEPAPSSLFGAACAFARATDAAGTPVDGEILAIGHRFIEEESWRPSPGAAIYAPP